MEQTTSQSNENPVSVTDETIDELVARRKAEGDPWAKMAGIFKDDPLFDEWVEIMRENRRKDDEALGI